MNRFLNFFNNDKVLGKDQLKFVKQFEFAVTHSDETTVGDVADMYPMNVILEKNGGRKVNEYDSIEEAMAHVRHLCAINQTEYGYEAKEERIDPKYPQFSKFWYKFSLGKKEKHVSKESKNLSAKGDVKTIGQLHAAKCFMEGLGYAEGYDGVDDSGVTIESVLYGELKQKVELIRLP